MKTLTHVLVLLTVLFTMTVVAEGPKELTQAEKAGEKECMKTLEEFNLAKAMYQKKYNKKDGEAIRWMDLSEFLPKRTLACPNRGSYAPNLLGEKVSCTIHGTGPEK